MMVLLSIATYAERNPSAVYCEESGYLFDIEKTEIGDKGICVLADGTRVGAWDFISGKDGIDYNYCTKNNLEYRILTDRSECNSIYVRDCIVCIVDGEEIEMTQLMQLDFSESPCGDGVCNSDESHNTCPEDCEIETIACVYDGICADACLGTEDIDCLCIDPDSRECKDAIGTEDNLMTYILLTGFILLLIVLILIVRKTKRILR